METRKYKHAKKEVKDEKTTKAKKVTKKPNNKPIPNRKGKVVNENLIGEISEEIKAKEKTSKENIKKTENKKSVANSKFYEKIKELKKDRKLCWGVVMDVKSDGKHVGFDVLWNNVCVTILDTAYFEDNYNLGVDFNRLNDAAKLKKLLVEARNTIGSYCPFIITGVTKVDFEKTPGEKEIVLTGSRKEALEKLRDIYFLHKNVDSKEEVNIGDFIEANVLFVGENYITVECCGVETRIDMHNTNDRFVDNCREYAKVGEKILVRVKKIYINDDKVYLSVSRRLNQSPKYLERLVKGATYLGYASSFNPNKKIYTCKILVPGEPESDAENFINVSVHEKSVQGHVELYVGDRVNILITEVNDKCAYGMAIKL